eukprot:TRINITY_DN6610_c0_g1_i1.p1 TRINITY_DN6610_c0_g1~~TRINITY_DN6610_c0_g1_i1.p1  ORF type:complete len:105 (+),score=25.86 TRINITY_DN6610_c0_g1_i1:74-388(+)
MDRRNRLREERPLQRGSSLSLSTGDIERHKNPANAKPTPQLVKGLSLEDMIRNAKKDGHSSAEKVVNNIEESKKDDHKLNAAANGVAVSMNHLMRDLRRDSAPG